MRLWLLWLRWILRGLLDGGNVGGLGLRWHLVSERIFVGRMVEVVALKQKVAVEDSRTLYA